MTSGVMGILLDGWSSRSAAVTASGLKAPRKGTLWPLYQRMPRYRAVAAKMAPTVYTIPSSTIKNIAAGPALSTCLGRTRCLLASKPFV